MCYTSSIDLLKLVLEYSEQSKELCYITDYLHLFIAYCEINVIKVSVFDTMGENCLMC